MSELDLSRPIARPSDRRNLVEEILAGTLGVDETTWLEWKSQVDWTKPEDVATKVARHIIGFANRDPAEAQGFVGGEAYLVFLPDATEPSRYRIDPADIENKVSPYLGTDGPQWSASHLDLNGSISLMLTIAPSRVGDHIYALRKQAAKYPNGTIFVRRPGKTEIADATDLRRLELRALAVTSQISIEVGAEPHSLPRLSVNRDISSFVQAERDRLLGPLSLEEFRIGGGQRDVLESLIGTAMLASYTERRKPSEFRTECEKYLGQIAGFYAQSGHHIAARKGFGKVELHVRNPSPRNLRAVEVELFFAAGIVASRGEWDQPDNVPVPPSPWGQDTVMSSILHPPYLGLGSYFLPGLAPRTPSLWHIGSGEGLVFEDFDLRPYQQRVLPPVHLFSVGSPAELVAEVRWRATAQNTDSRADGVLAFEIEDAEVTLEDLRGDAPAR